MTVGLDQFNPACLELVDRVVQTGEEVIITLEGQAMAKLVPAPRMGPGEIFGKLAHITEIRGDIVASTGPAWEADA